MDPLQRLHIRAACEDLVVRYTHLCDQRDHASFTRLFTEDAVWTRPAGEFRGHAAIRAAMDARDAAQTRHVMGSIHIEVLDADHATGLSYCTVYRDLAWRGQGPARLDTPEMLVDYRDRFLRVQGQWRIASRHTTLVFQRG